MFQKKEVSNFFLLAVLLVSLYLVYLFLRPFLAVIIISAVLVSFFYKPYQKLVGWLKGREGLAALIMVLLIAIVIILPVTDFLFYLSKESIDAFGSITAWISSGNLERVFNNNILERYNFIDSSIIDFRQYLVTITSRISNFLISGGTMFLKSATDFFTSLIVMFFTMYFLFRDGKKLAQRAMYLTPLPNKYDREIFQKFRDVSYSTIVSTFVTALLQGMVGALGFFFVGIPAFFAGITMALFSLMPYIGSAVIWFPTAIYLLVTGRIWQGAFLLFWGFLVVSVIDNIVRPYLIKGRAQVHPLIIFFSIFGGIMAFGFLGMFIGPIIVAITFTLLRIYEMEYVDVLDKS